VYSRHSFPLAGHVAMNMAETRSKTAFKIYKFICKDVDGEWHFFKEIFCVEKCTTAMRDHSWRELVVVSRAYMVEEEVFRRKLLGTIDEVYYDGYNRPSRCRTRPKRPIGQQ